MFVVALFTITKVGNNPNDRRKVKTVAHTMKHYCRAKGQLALATTGMNFKSIQISERSQTQKVVHTLYSVLNVILEKIKCRDRKHVIGFQELGWAGEEMLTTRA